jgi:hypothetical protein
MPPGSAYLPRLLHFRDSYYARSGLLDYLSSDGMGDEGKAAKRGERWRLCCFRKALNTRSTKSNPQLA